MVWPIIGAKAYVEETVKSTEAEKLLRFRESRWREIAIGLRILQLGYPTVSGKFRLADAIGKVGCYKWVAKAAITRKPGLVQRPLSAPTPARRPPSTAAPPSCGTDDAPLQSQMTQRPGIDSTADF